MCGVYLGFTLHPHLETWLGSNPHKIKVSPKNPASFRSNFILLQRFPKTPQGCFIILPTAIRLT